MLAVTVCGAVDPSAELGSLVCFDDLHFLANRLPDGEPVHVLHGAGARERGHWIYEGPFSADAAARAARRARRRRAWRCATAAATATSTGRASTPRAEIRGLAACGVTAVSQTAGPETVLCGEAELPYALLGFLTDYANGVKDEATPVETLVEMMAASTDAFAAVLRAALPRAAAATPGAAGRRLPLRSGLSLASRLAGAQRRATRTVVSAWPEIAEVVVAEGLAAGAADRGSTPS